MSADYAAHNLRTLRSNNFADKIILLGELIVVQNVSVKIGGQGKLQK